MFSDRHLSSLCPGLQVYTTSVDLVDACPLYVVSSSLFLCENQALVWRRAIQFSRNRSRRILPRSFLGSSDTMKICFGIFAADRNASSVTTTMPVSLLHARSARASLPLKIVQPAARRPTAKALTIRISERPASAQSRLRLQRQSGLQKAYTESLKL
jgi:hypothetical protein